MKIEHLIAQYLYTNKKVTLQDIGVFYLSDNVTIPMDHAKDAVLPDNAITFEYNIKAKQDEGLVDFIVQQTRKIRPLASSDLESFTILGRQFMNIGKPLPIGGLGILQKNQHGEYEFIQGHTVNPRLEPVPANLKEKDEEEIVFATPPRKTNGKTGMVIALVLFLLLVASVAFYFVYKNNKDKKNEQMLVQNTSTDTSQVKKDSSIKPTIPLKDTINPAVVMNNDPGSFKIVIREYKTQSHTNEIYSRYKSWGHNIIQYTNDSSVYKLAIVFSRPLSDSTKIKDSLQTIFVGSTPYLEKN
jgi:hypothetical protein